MTKGFLESVDLTVRRGSQTLYEPQELIVPGQVATHTDKRAYDRILVSDAIAKGQNHLRLERVAIQEHRHGKGEERRLYTDHFPVVATLRLQ